MMSKQSPALDPYSTSQTHRTRVVACASHELKCIYHAPFFAYATEGKHYAVSQGNCHHWDCPKCGIGRAKQEYWKIVSGCDELSKQGHEIWFITITTRGADLSVEEAERGYLQWTNRFLTNLRQHAARHNMHWCYVQVTERQRRRHPHSHILTTFQPDDAVEGCKENWVTLHNGIREMEYIDALRSDYLQSAVCSSGLGEQYDVSKVRDSAAVARYVGKYLFKSSLLTKWPDGWRRVRYSQNWPKQAEVESTAFVLITREDWYNLATCAETVTVKTQAEFEIVSPALWSYPVKVRVRKNSPFTK